MSAPGLVPDAASAATRQASLPQTQPFTMPFRGLAAMRTQSVLARQPRPDSAFGTNLPRSPTSARLDLGPIHTPTHPLAHSAFRANVRGLARSGRFVEGLHSARTPITRLLPAAPPMALGTVRAAPNKEKRRTVPHTLRPLQLERGHTVVKHIGQLGQNGGDCCSYPHGVNE